MFSTRNVMVNFTAFFATTELFVTVKVGVYTPGFVGEPESLNVLASNFSPVGSPVTVTLGKDSDSTRNVAVCAVFGSMFQVEPCS